MRRSPSAKARVKYMQDFCFLAGQPENFRISRLNPSIMIHGEYPGRIWSRISIKFIEQAVIFGCNVYQGLWYSKSCHNFFAQQCAICKSRENGIPLICGIPSRTLPRTISIQNVTGNSTGIVVILLYDVSFYAIRRYRTENWSRCTVPVFLRCGRYREKRLFPEFLFNVLTASVKLLFYDGT